MKILDWAAGVSTIIILVLVGLGISEGGGDAAYAIGYKYGKVLLVCCGIIGLWWFINKR